MLDVINNTCIVRLDTEIHQNTPCNTDIVRFDTKRLHAIAQRPHTPALKIARLLHPYARLRTHVAR